MKQVGKLTLIAMLLGPAIHSSAAAQPISFPAHAIVASIAAQGSKPALQSQVLRSLSSPSPRWLRKGLKQGLRTSWTRQSVRSGINRGVRDSSRVMPSSARFR